MSKAGNGDELGTLVFLVGCIIKAGPIYQKQFVANYFEPLKKVFRKKVS